MKLSGFVRKLSATLMFFKTLDEDKPKNKKAEKKPSADNSKRPTNIYNHLVFI